MSQSNEVIDYLNKVAGTSYRHGTKKADTVIGARISEGATFDDFVKCIDNKVKGWRGTEQEQYLRPETLFGTKFWGYVNERKTNVIEEGNRSDLIKAVLKASGMRDVNTADVMIYNEVLKLISTSDLPQFAVSLIRNGGEFMRPDQMMSKAVKEFETKILTSSLQNGKKIKGYDKFVDFVQYSFRGKAICNGLYGLYKPFVTIGMDRDGYLVNQFTWKKLSSQDEQDAYKWLFENQSRVGVVEHIEHKIDAVPEIEHKEPYIKEIENSQKVSSMLSYLTQKVRVSN